MDTILVPAGGGQVLDSQTGFRILEDGSNTGHRIGVMVDSLPPGSHGPPQHIHRKHSETFSVVSGTIRFTSGSEHVDVSPGGLVTAPIGVPHTFSNPDPDQWATFACTVAPDLYISYFRDLAVLRAQSGGADKVSPNTDLQIMARYAAEPCTPPGS